MASHLLLRHQNTVDGTVNRLRGSIWATHTLKSLANKAKPLRLETVILPTPTELLRFRITTDEGATWTNPQHFSIDDYGCISTNRNASFLLDHSQQLINTRLDETLDAATGNFIPDISILGRQVRQRDENYTSSRIFPDIHQYPYATTEGSRARLYQQPFITNSPRPPLIPSLIPQARSREQLQLITQLQAGATQD